MVGQGLGEMVAGRYVVFGAFKVCGVQGGAQHIHRTFFAAGFGQLMVVFHELKTIHLGHADIQEKDIRKMRFSIAY